MANTSKQNESEEARNERIFQGLPKLGSPEYVALLETATATDLPAPVLVRAFRQLRGPVGADGRLSRPAEKTLERLLMTDAKYGYMRGLKAMATRKVSNRDWFDANELFHEAKQEIALALTGARGEGAHKAWVRFQRQRLTDAYRRLVGRRSERQGPDRLDHLEHVTDEGDLLDRATGEGIDWHGSMEPDNERWFEEFMRRTFARITDDRIREVALDQFVSNNPSPISSKDPKDERALTNRYGVSRTTVNEWLRIAKTRLLVELLKQDERDIDTTWLTNG